MPKPSKRILPRVALGLGLMFVSIGSLFFALGAPANSAPALDLSEAMPVQRVALQPVADTEQARPELAATEAKAPTPRAVRAAPTIASKDRVPPPYEGTKPLKFETFDLFVEHAKPTEEQLVALETIFYDGWVNYWTAYDRLVNQGSFGKSDDELELIIDEIVSDVGAEMMARSLPLLSERQQRLFRELFPRNHIGGVAAGNLAYSIRALTE